MEQIRASANLFLDKSRTLKGTNKHPVNIRICHNRKQWMTGLRIYCTEDDYKRAMSDKGSLNPRLRELRGCLLEKRKKAIDVLNCLKSITRDNFNTYFLSEIDLQPASSIVDLKSQFEAYINDMYEDDRIRSAELYTAALKSFLSFRPNCELRLVDEEYLKKYATFMSKGGRSSSTTKMYLETMRSIMNRSIKKGLLHRKDYPFTEYSIGGAAMSKKALYPHQVKQLWEMPVHNETQRLAKDMWFLSYLCHGANNVDLMKLKWKDISNNRITFYRSKTNKTTKNSRPIVVYMHDEVKAIMERHGNKDRKPDGFVFPVLNGLTSEKEMVKKIRDWRRHVNRCLNRMGKRIGFDFLLSLSIARHSFATALKFKGTAIAVISDCMGHTSIGTTEHYLSSIPDDMKQNITSQLLNFNTQ